MRNLADRVLYYLAFLLCWMIEKYIDLTCRKEHRGPLLDYLKNDKPFLMTWWHQDLIVTFGVLVPHLRKRPTVVIVSRSRDGEFAAYVIRKLTGCDTARGSSSRGGFEAFREAVSLIKEKSATGIVIADGPRPPARLAKAGIAALSRATGLPIIPVRSWGKRQYLFKKSWPRLVIPYPFSPIVVLSAGPVTVPPGATRDEIEKYRLRVEKELNRLADESERHFV